MVFYQLGRYLTFATLYLQRYLKLGILIVSIRFKQITIPLLSIETDLLSTRNIGDLIKLKNIWFLRYSKQNSFKKLMSDGELMRVVVLVKIFNYLE